MDHRDGLEGNDLENNRGKTEAARPDLSEDENLEFYRQDIDDMNSNFTSRAFEVVHTGGLPDEFQPGLCDGTKAANSPPEEPCSKKKEAGVADLNGGAAELSVSSDVPKLLVPAFPIFEGQIIIHSQPATSTSTSDAPSNSNSRSPRNRRKRLNVMSYGMQTLRAAVHEHAEHMKADQERTWSTRQNPRDRVALRAAREVSNIRKRLATEMREGLEAEFGNGSSARARLE